MALTEIPKYDYGITCSSSTFMPLYSGPFTYKVAKEWVAYCDSKFPDCGPHRIINWKDRPNARKKKKGINRTTGQG